MKTNFEIYFHLGLPKVASTYFQNVVFPNLAGIRYYEKHQFLRYKDITEAEGGRHLFSIEKDKRLVETVEEIVGQFPDAKIILFVRKHGDWIISRYKYHIRKHGAYSFKEFFNIEEDTGIWKKEDLIWRDKIENIEQLCKTPPLVLTFDELKKNPGAFIETITSFTGTELISKKKLSKKVLKAFNEKQLIVLRKFNRLFHYRPAKSLHPTLNKTHRKYREFILHILSFVTHIIPGFLISGKSVFTEEDEKDFEKIREYYKSDWDFCQKYSGTHF